MHRLRLVELLLLALAAAFAAAGLADLALFRRVPVEPALWPALVLGGTFLAGHVALALRRPGADQVLLPLAAALCGLGVLVIDRVAPDLLVRQALWLVVGMALFLAVVVGGDVFGWLRRYRYTWALLGLGLVAVTLVLGVDPNNSGVRIWIGFGGYMFQPAELVKVLMVAFFAAYLDEHRELLSLGGYRLGPIELPPLPYLAPSLVMLGVSLLLFLVQHDLGITFLFFGVFVAMLYAVSGRGVYVLSALGTLAGASYLVYHLFSVARLRMEIWLHPWLYYKHERGPDSYQVVQALVAFASGGILGTGPGYGAPLLIPAAFTDFPFAVIGEELGLVGTLAVVALYLIFTVRGFRIALDLGDNFRGLLAMGLTTALGLQALIILAGNLKLVPLTGITLPFVSYGGSSLVTNFIILGLLVRLSAEAPRRAVDG